MAGPWRGYAWSGGLAWIFTVVILGGFGPSSTRAANVWQQIDVTPYINCSHPLCDFACQDMEDNLGQICPRAASTNLKIYGALPGPKACEKKVLNWVSGPKPSAADPDGCGPCLLKDEKSICNTRRGGRGFNAGGPPPRRGHTMIRYETPVRSSYLGAVVLILFGGVDRNDKFLNDVWFFCVDKCPLVMVNKRTFDSIL